MATNYAYGTNTEWTDTGVTGPCTIQAQNGESLIHFGTTLPATYSDGKHIHIEVGDIPWYYGGTDKVYIRSGNDNVSGMTVKTKVAIVND